MYCFHCRHFGRNLRETAFVIEGFNDWKHAFGEKDRGIIPSHTKSASHSSSEVAFKEWEKRRFDNTVLQVLDKHNRQEIEENRRYLTYIVNTIVFLGRQGLALRGSDESSGSFQRGNFLELVDYTANLSPEFASLKKKMRRNATYLSPEIQNELITLIGNHLLDEISDELSKVKYFCLSADETKDTSHQEQLCVTLRYLKDGNVVERFVGFHPLEQLNARFMAEKITKVVSKVVPMDKCVAQVYDGAAVMKGQKNGVNAIISQDYPKALYLHCQSHVLNLCLVGTVSSVQEAEDFFCVLKTLYAFVTSSAVHPKFVSVQEQMKSPKEQVKHLKSWPDTRWFCRISAIRAVHGTYAFILETLNWFADEEVNAERRLKATALKHQVAHFEFLLMLHVMLKLFSITESLTLCLQAKSLHAKASIDLIESTIAELELLSQDDWFDEIFEQCLTLAGKYEFPVTLRSGERRKAKLPEKFSDSVVTHKVPDRRTDAMSAPDAKVLAKRVCSDVVSMMVGEMKSRFSNKTLQFLRGFGALEPMIMREGVLIENDQFLNSDDLLAITEFYGLCSQSDFLAEARVALDGMKLPVFLCYEASKELLEVFND